ncbi:MAG: SelT/SelW/SelH family protein [Gammaproteobacteria bacterium]|nr:MAG: SelT/SelW/SelH family protein [Chloroflexota bacterium]TDJ25227.1 MAG: SelT/SelW/SelH family protein [Gammaproteobacteria bacterium]TDJ39181.1 MAG: SelT/SelW/SelH family protein [Gammaproteobacteria bacterium]
MTYRVEIRYCTKCKWLLRSAWMAQELLSTFEDDISEVALVPGANAVFEIKINGSLIWSREKDGGFPEIKVLKSLVRDVVAPNKDLGHIDRKLAESGNENDA